MEKVFVTSFGAITPLGSGKTAFWEALKAGKSGVKEVTRFDTDWLPVHIAAEVEEFDELDQLTSEEKKQLDPAAQLALSCSREALCNADLLLPSGYAQLPDMPLFLATTHGDLFAHFSRHFNYWEKKDHQACLDQVKEMLCHNIAYGLLSATAKGLGLTGLQSMNTNACAGSGYALSLGVEHIRQGRGEMALCGGVDVTSPANYSGFCSLRALAPEACQPFDIRRRGLVMGEGCGMILLESESSLKNRGHQPIAELVGYGWSNDAHHLSSPHPEGRGVVKALKGALEDAGLLKSEIDFVVAHGTGTPANDVVEAQAFKTVFGENTPPVTAPKSSLGHTMGAASVIEAIVGIQGLVHQCIPPTIHHNYTDPKCPIEVVAKTARNVSATTCLTNSSGFGGNNDSLIFKIYPS